MKNPRTRAHRLARPSVGMPSSTELRFIVAFTLAGAVACGSSQTEDFFASAPPLGAAGATGSAGGLATGGAAGSGVATGGSAGSSIGSGGDTSGSGGTSGAGGLDAGVGGSAGLDPGTGGVGGSTGGVGGTTGGSAGDAPIAGSPGAGAGGLAGTGGAAGLGAGGSDGGAPAGGRGGRDGRGGGGGSGPMQCTAVLTSANKALEAAQVCNLAVSSLQCVEMVETPCGCLVPIAKPDSMATKTYLAALKALESCPVSCTEAVCQNPNSGHCEPDSPSSAEGHCVGDNDGPTRR